MRLYWDVSNLKFEKHERGMKMVLSSRLRSEVVNPDVCQGFTTGEANAAGPDKVHPRFLHHMDPVSISLLMSIFNKLWVETKVPQEWRVADIRPIPRGGSDLRKMENLYPSC